MQAQQLQGDVARLQEQLQDLQAEASKKVTLIRRLQDQERSLNGQIDGLQSRGVEVE